MILDTNAVSAFGFGESSIAEGGRKMLDALSSSRGPWRVLVWPSWLDAAR